jgi:hypothetical protein
MHATRVAGKQGASCKQTLLKRDHAAVSPCAGWVSTIAALRVLPILTSGADEVRFIAHKSNCLFMGTAAFSGALGAHFIKGFGGTYEKLIVKVKSIWRIRVNRFNNIG